MQRYEQVAKEQEVMLTAYIIWRKFIPNEERECSAGQQENVVPINNLSKLNPYSQEYKKFIKNLTNLSKEESAKALDPKALADSLSEVAPLLSIRFRLGAIIRNAYHMLTTHDYKEVFDYLYDELQAVIPYDRLGIALIEGDRIHAHWIRSKFPAQFLNINYSASTKSGGLSALIRTGTPRIISDLRDYYENNPTSQSTKLAIKDGIISSLTFPLVSSKETVGVIFFSSYIPSVYTEDHIQIFQEIVEDFTIILGQGRIKQRQIDNLTNDKMLSMVVHDLRSPVGVIMGFLDLLFEEQWFEKLDKKDKNVFLILKRTSERMLGLINELSDIKKISNDQMEFKNKNIHFKKYINEVFEDARMIGQQKNIPVECKASEAVPEYVLFDPQRIRQALDNLISNAIKFSKPETLVIINVYIEDEKLYFSVIDHGPGIPVLEQAILFTEFGKTSVRPTAGEYTTGLGLSLVKKIVVSCGGSVAVRSSEGKGSEFVFWIPLKTGSKD